MSRATHRLRAVRVATAAALTTGLSTFGCETLIGARFGDAERAPNSTPDAGDAGAAGTNTGGTGGTDAGQAGGIDAGQAGGTDAGQAGGTDAMETGTDAGADGSMHGDAGDEASVPHCDPLHAPERMPGPSSTDTLDFVVVLRNADFGDTVGPDGLPRYLSTGHDIDGLCTDARTPNCVAPDWVEVNLVDGPRGQDNAIGKLLMDQAVAFGAPLLTSQSMARDVDAGYDAPVAVLRVTGFSGFAEDDRVTVEWFVPAPPDPEAPPPGYDENDAWRIADAHVEDVSGALASDSLAVYRDEQAFVTKRQLVAHFERVVFPLKNVYFRMYDVALEALTVPESSSGHWILDQGIVSGRSPVAEILGVVPVITYEAFGVPLCTDDTLNYPTVKRFLCATADLPEVPGDPTSLCLGASSGFFFQTAPASLGPLVTVPTPVSPCAPGTDPVLDDCLAPPGGDPR